MTFEKGNQINVGRECSEETRKKISSKKKNLFDKIPEIIDLYKQGKSTRDIGKLYNCSKTNILYILKNSDIALRGYHTLEGDKKIKEYLEKNKSKVWENEKEIIRLYKKKLFSSNKIAERYKCSESLISNILRKNGIVRNQPERIKLLYQKRKIKVWNKRNDLREKTYEIIKLYEDELLSSKEIGKIYNCSGVLIENILKEQRIIMDCSERRKLLYFKKKLIPWNKLNLNEKSICEMYPKKSVTNLSKIFHCSTVTIFKILKRNKIEIKGSKYFNKGKHNSLKTEFKKGDVLSEEMRKKIRQGIFEYIKKINGIMWPRLGHNEKQILDKLEQEKGYKILRQYKVEGYHIDGYIPELKLAIEIDEKSKNTEKDIKRQKIIEKKLNCKFMRINDFNPKKSSL